MEEFRHFLQAILSVPIPKPPKRKRMKRPEPGGMTIKPDEFLTHTGKPFRFSRRGAKRPIQKRKR